MVAVMAVALAWWKAEPARSATAVPQGFTDNLVAQLNKPTSTAVAPDGRLFVTQKATNNVGKVRVIKSGQLLSKPFLMLDTDTSYDRGVLGITLDSNFSTNHYVYVFYTATPTVHNRVSRFTANSDVAVAGSERVLLDLATLGATETEGHYGESLRFGPNGKLHVGVGDDTTPADAQSLGTVDGKILRINPDGTIPSDDPFYGSTYGDNRAIYALRLRQPYSLDVLSGTSPKMYINDVGENLWEEIDQATPGANYGWSGYAKASWLHQIPPSRTTRTLYSPTRTAVPSTLVARSPAGRCTTRPRCASQPSTRATTSTRTTAADG
jgi:glucose/arabinose dehydrogenase